MSRLIDNITTEVGNLTPSYSFHLGSVPEANVEGDEITSPAVFLRAEITGTHPFAVNKLVRSAYTVTMSFMSNVVPELTAAENQPAIDNHYAIAWELLRRLSELEDAENRLIFVVPPAAITTTTVYHEFDSNWVGVQMTVTLELYEDFNVCIS